MYEVQRRKIRSPEGGSEGDTENRSKEGKVICSTVMI